MKLDQAIISHLRAAPDGLAFADLHRLCRGNSQSAGYPTAVSDRFTVTESAVYLELQNLAAHNLVRWRDGKVALA